jgi:hypothetical protein
MVSTRRFIKIFIFALVLCLGKLGTTQADLPINITNKTGSTLYLKIKARTDMKDVNLDIFERCIEAGASKHIDFPEGKIFTLRSWKIENDFNNEDKTKSIHAISKEPNEIKTCGEIILYNNSNVNSNLNYEIRENTALTKQLQPTTSSTISYPTQDKIKRFNSPNVFTKLINAINENNSAAVFDLLEFTIWKPDVNSPVPVTGLCPLHMAIKNKNLDVVQQLVNNEANINFTVNISGKDKNPLDLAEERGLVDIARFLEKNGAIKANQEVTSQQQEQRPQTTSSTSTEYTDLPSWENSQQQERQTTPSPIPEHYASFDEIPEQQQKNEPRKEKPHASEQPIYVTGPEVQHQQQPKISGRLTPVSWPSLQQQEPQTTSNPMPEHYASFNGNQEQQQKNEPKPYASEQPNYVTGPDMQQQQQQPKIPGKLTSVSRPSQQQQEQQTIPNPKKAQKKNEPKKKKHHASEQSTHRRLTTGSQPSQQPQDQ